MSRTHKAHGFTLIELMLVAVLLGIVGLAIVATFAGGLKIFDRAENYTAAKADVFLAMEKLEKDLRSAFPVKGIDFIGEARKMAFPAILQRFSAKGRAEESLGSVSYYRGDAGDAGVLSREEKTYAEAVKKENSGHGEIEELASIQDIHFQYLSYDPQTETYRWDALWVKPKVKEEEKRESHASKGVFALEDRSEDLPLGVKIKIGYADGDKFFTLDRTVFIKTAVSLNLAKKRAKAEKKSSQKAESEH